MSNHINPIAGSSSSAPLPFKIFLSTIPPPMLLPRGPPYELFFDIVERFYMHLLLSPSSRAAYLSILMKIYTNHPPAQTQFGTKPPDDAYILDFLHLHFPRIILQSYASSSGIGNWGQVEKGSNAPPDELRVLVNLALALDSSYLHPAKYLLNPLLIQVLAFGTLAHELAHALTKTAFGTNLITPPNVGVGDDGAGYGESGWYLERELYGTGLVGHWDGLPTGVETVREIVSEMMPDGNEYYLTTTFAADFLASTATPTLLRFDPHMHPNHAVLAPPIPHPNFDPNSNLPIYSRVKAAAALRAGSSPPPSPPNSASRQAATRVGLQGDRVIVGDAQ